jgi:hypothetical protein
LKKELKTRKRELKKEKGTKKGGRISSPSL